MEIGKLPMASAGCPSPGQQSRTVQEVIGKTYFVSDTTWQEILMSKRRYDLIVIGSGFCGLGVVKRALKNNSQTRILMLERGDFLTAGHLQDFGFAYDRDLDKQTKTFPWTLSEATNNGSLGLVTGLHGAVPFFGGKSTLWTAWCPRPTQEEMSGWPEETIRQAMTHFDAADELLGVQAMKGSRLQLKVNQLLKDSPSIPHLKRVEPARISLKSEAKSNVEYRKFSTPVPLMELVNEQQRNGGAEFHIAVNIIVQNIIRDGENAVALQTSRGTVSLNGARLVLAMGTLPSTTLLRNSFPEVAAKWPKRFSAHFKSCVTIRVPLYDEVKEEEELDVAASHITGCTNSRMQFHIQVVGIAEPNTESGRSRDTALTFVPTIEHSQLQSSAGYAIFVLAVVGELSSDNPLSFFRDNPKDTDVTTNSELQIQSNTEKDCNTWETMNRATLQVVELLRNGKVEYWRKLNNDQYGWTEAGPDTSEMCKPFAVHEASTLHIGDTEDAPVATDYNLRGVGNVFVTGGALWPVGGSWNPTPTMVALAMDLADRLVPRENLVRL